MWKIKKSKTAYECGPISVNELDAIDPYGNEKNRVSISLGGDSVIVIPRTSNLEFLLGKQYRVGEEREVIEFPNGGIEPNESYEEAAKRELNEETGYTGEFSYLGSFSPLVGLMDLDVHVFLCDNIYQVDNKLEADSYEAINTTKVSENELEEMIKDQKIFDGFTLSALTLYNNYKK